MPIYHGLWIKAHIYDVVTVWVGIGYAIQTGKQMWGEV